MEVSTLKTKRKMKSRGFRIKKTYDYYLGMGSAKYRVQVHILGWISIAEVKTKEEAVQVITLLLKSDIE